MISSIGRSKRGSLVNTLGNPGPGQYDGSLAKTSPSYTIRGDRNTVKHENSPGPGQYNPKDYNKTIVPAYAIGRSQRGSLRTQKGPGPGAYNLDKEKSGPQWRIGTEKKLSASVPDTPGPGAYENTLGNVMPAYSMTSRRPLSYEFRGPGPGDYSPSRNYSKIGYSIGRASRGTFASSDNPGPASYFINGPRAKGAVFGMSQRKFVVENEKNPGPGSYETGPSGNAPKYTIRSKNKLNYSQEVPVIYI